MIAVIGDVHGCFYTLQNLVENVRAKYPDIQIFCVGDLIDRGNHSCEVIEYILTEGISFTPGNHDYMFYSFFRDPDSLMAKAWIHNGAETTLSSYENRTEKIDDHLNVIKSAPLFINNEDCFISHAGISQNLKSKLPKDILNNLSEVKNILTYDLYDKESILWCRSKLLNIGKLQVVGHTHRKEVFFEESTNTIYIDTTAFGMNKLSAVIIENNKVLEIIEQRTMKDDTDSRWNYYL